MGKEIFAYANPRKRRRGKRRGRRRGRSRRNPELLALANPRRRRRGRRRSRRSFSFFGRARRNPGFSGRLPLVGVPVSDLVYNGIGAAGGAFVSSMVMKFFPALKPNPAKPNDMLEQVKPYAIDFAAAFLVGQVGGMIFKSPSAKAELAKGAMLNPLFRLLRSQVFPRLGLSGDEFNSSAFEGVDFFEPDGVGEFMNADGQYALSGFGQDPVLDRLMLDRHSLYGSGGAY